MYQLEKELKAVGVSREVEIGRLRGDYERVCEKEREVQEGKWREMESKLGKLMEEHKQLEEKNEKLHQEN